MRWWLPVLLGALFSGCTPESKLKPVDNDFETPLFKRAKEKFELRDYEGSIALYEQVLRENPHMAKAHLELGLINDDKLGDYVSAIFHYRRYLALRPDGEKAGHVRQWIPRAEMAFAAQQPNSPLQNADELSRLQKENLTLKAEIEEARRVRRELDAQLRAALAQPVSRAAAPPPQVEPLVPTRPQSQAAAPPPPRPAPQAPANPPSVTPAAVAHAPVAQVPPARTPVAPPPAAQAPQPMRVAEAPAPAPPRAELVAPAATGTQPKAGPAGRVHSVQEGETLWRIASRYYPGDAQRGVERIQEANRANVSDVTKLRVGQQLKIP